MTHTKLAPLSLRSRLLGLTMIVSSVLAGGTAAADGPPGSVSHLIRNCPAGTTAAVVNGQLRCTSTFKCPWGYDPQPVNDGLICFKRENLVSAADCNNCSLGWHTQKALNEDDTCQAPFGPSEPSKLACCNGAIRWQDKDGLLDVCGFFAAPAPSN
jgi:hypothetical protein